MNAFQALAAAQRSAKDGSKNASGTSGGHTVDPRIQPWVEKYRPKTIEDVSAQEHTVAVLKKTLQAANLPHMLFYGPPGTGKTSTILALARQLFGPEQMKTRVLELNASDERGISVVREKVKNFARIALSPPQGDYPCPPYKIIILDEADSMTQDAQSALRRIMEAHSKITRFCLICNYVTRIIEPITSRCSKFRFKPLDNTNTLKRLKEICEKESVNVPGESLHALIKTADGDLRRAITYLQSASRLHGSEAISSTSIQEIGGVVPDPVMRELGRALGVDQGDDDGDVEMNGGAAGGSGKGKTGGSTFERVKGAVTKIARDGYSATQILSQLHDLIILNPLLNTKAKSTAAIVLGEADKVLTDGADEELQILNACLKIANAIRTSS